MKHRFTKIIENKARSKQPELHDYRPVYTIHITYKDSNTPTPAYFVFVCFLNAATMSDAAAEASERNLSVLQVLLPVFNAMYQDTTYRPATMVKAILYNMETGMDLYEDSIEFEIVPSDARRTGFMGACYGREYIHIIYKLLHTEIERIPSTVVVRELPQMSIKPRKH
ncbi:hypothetical protein N5D45_06835 [Stenotrophomonas sp. GD03819]|uniref:hypothetical protein n=1 Tax=Stenotrophomonas TaxID=40323 RepID=UPI0013DAD465|nr:MULTISPECIES: hypothetical protein [Stenotrophomonas]MDH1791535.1 hypothetical protein [Stenotrophomonas sp. GD03819]